MERTQGVKSRIALIIILLFHIVGLTGFFIDSVRPMFLQIVPFHLLLMLAVIVYNHDNFSARFLLFAAITFVAGFAFEWIGVHKQWIFGDYHYGQTLGLKLWDIPLTIGVNWFLLVYSAGVLMQRSRIKSVVARVVIGAVLLVALDFLIEPVAIKFDYWYWTFGKIPLKNYVGWFIVSSLFLYVFELFKFKKQNMVAPVLLIVQFVFFALLHLA